MGSAANLILMRHGESEWNVRGLVTGWADVKLTPRGHAQASAAGAMLAADGLRVDVIFTSALRRAVQSVGEVTAAMAAPLPEVASLWQLNERHWGQLQGLGKEAIKCRWGADQRQRWRRDPEALPPPLKLEDARHPRHDPYLARVPAVNLPDAERMIDVRRRVLEAWQTHVQPKLDAGATVAVVAHRDSLRVLIAELEGVELERFAEIVVPHAAPRAYRVNGAVGSLCCESPL